MGKRRPEDYKQDHRIYTGLYTAKAFNMLKDMLPSVLDEYSYVVPIRDVSGETVLVTYRENWDKLADRGFSSCRDWMLHDLRDSFTRAVGLVGNGTRDERGVVALFILQGENALNAEQKKILSKLRGIPRDVITSELNACLAEEETKIEREYVAFAETLGRMDRFGSATDIFGSAWNLPKETSVPDDPVRPEFYPADVLDKLLKARAECLGAFNTLARSSSQYLKVHARYSSILADAKKLNTKIKNDRIKALRREFTAAKRTSK